MNKKGGTLGLNMSILFVSIFVLSVLLFATQYGQDNSAAVTIGEESRLTNAALLNGSLTTYNSGNNVTVKAVYGGEVQDGSDSLDRVSTFETGSEATLPTIANLTKESAFVLFGNNTNVLWIISAFIAFLGLSYALYAWKTFKQGAPD